MNRRSRIVVAVAATVCTVAPVGALASAHAGGDPAVATTTVPASASPARDGQPEAALQASVDQVTRELAVFDRVEPRAAASRVGVDIPVYVKVFYDRQTGAGKLTHQQALDQVKWLNHSYHAGQDKDGAKTRFDFVFKAYKNIPVDSRRVDISGNTNGNGANYNSERTKRLMRDHHDGGVSTLNLYVADLPGSTLGISTFPQFAKAHPGLDGIWIDRATWRSTPGEGGAFTSQGDTAVHEVGHWIGALAHTDTSGACRVNFMSYASDACMTSFTKAQAKRMSSAWSRYRD